MGAFAGKSNGNRPPAGILRAGDQSDFVLKSH